MENQTTKIFESKEFCFLEWMKSREQETKQGNMILFSQGDIAEEYGCSLATANKWLKELQQAGCIEQKKKGCYQITQTGNAVLNQMKKIEKMIAKGAV